MSEKVVTKTPNPIVNTTTLCHCGQPRMLVGSQTDRSDAEMAATCAECAGH